MTVRDELENELPAKDMPASADQDEGVSDQEQGGRHRKGLGLWGRLRAYFLAGVLITCLLYTSPSPRD